MQNLLDNFMDEKYKKWHVLMLSILVILISSQVMKPYPLIGLPILLGGIYLMRMFFDMTSVEQEEAFSESELSNTIPENWAYSIKNGIITIVRSDKHPFRIAKNFARKNADIDILWTDSFKDRNLATDIANGIRKPSYIIKSLKLVLGKNTSSVREYSGDGTGLIEFIRNL